MATFACPRSAAVGANEFQPRASFGNCQHFGRQPNTSAVSVTLIVAQPPKRSKKWSIKPGRWIDIAH
jgi:hypothetical protein